jgi:arabinose-5-phosphate isomerase
VDIIDIVKKTLKLEADAIYALIDEVGDDFIKAVELIFDCKGRIVVTGMGKSGIIGKKIAATLSSTGTPALFLHPAEGVHGDLGMLTKNDVVLALSNSGETAEIISILPVIKRFNIPLIAITGNKRSTLAKKCDCLLYAGVEREACPLNLAPTSSTTASLAVGDALAVALLEKRGFKEEDFAIFHPSGVLGKKLLLKVEDLYHYGDEFPYVFENALVSDAVIKISEKGFGCSVILDKNKNLKGIITDGDIRRGVEKFRNIFEMNIFELASKSPKTIKKEELAAKALAIMEEYSITSIVVVDDENKPEGIIHMHDILKAGII